MRDWPKGIDCSFSSSSPEGRLDQKKPLQSRSSKMYGIILVSILMQFKTKKIQLYR